MVPSGEQQQPNTQPSPEEQSFAMVRAVMDGKEPPAEPAAPSPEKPAQPEATPGEKAAEAEAKPASGEGPDGTKQGEPQEGEPEAGKEPPWVKTRLSKIAAQRREAESRAETEKARADDLQRQLDALRGSDEPAKRTPDAIDPKDPRPEIDKYDDPDKCYIDLSAWSARQEHARLKKADEDRLTRETEAKSAREAAAAYNARADAFREKHPDFEEVTGKVKFSESPEMVVGIVESEVGPEIAYYLGQHPEEAKRIMALPTASAIERAIGRLEQKLSTPAQKESPAPAPPPAPPEKVGGSGTPPEPQPGEDWGQVKKFMKSQ